MSDYIFIRSVKNEKIGFYIVLKAVRDSKLSIISANGYKRQCNDNIKGDDYLWIVFNEGDDFVLRENSSSSTTCIVFFPELKDMEIKELEINSQKITI